MLATSAATFPLTAAQRDVWLDQISRGDSPLYNIGGYLQLSGAVDPVTLHKALEQLVCAHEVLRTVLMPGAGADGMPLQSYAACLPVSLPLHDVSGYPEPEQAARALINDNMRRPYVLDGSPLLDFCLIRLADDRHWLAGQAHHLILDGWGFGQLFKSLGELYSALMAGNDLELVAPGYSAFIADDARYQASQRYSLDRAYWLEKYRDLPEPLLVSRYHNRRATDPAPSHAWVQPLPGTLHARMKQFAERHNASAFHVLLAVLHVYFTRTAQRDEWIVGLPLLNRSGARFKATLGHFAQVSAVRMAFDDGLDFAALVVEVRDALKRDFRHQRFPLSELNRSLELSREGRAQLFEVSVSYELEDHGYCYTDAQAQTVKVSNGYEATPLAVHLRSNSCNDEASLHLVHHRAWIEDDEAQAIAGRLLHILEQGLENPALKIQDFHLSVPAEQLQLTAWNQTERVTDDEQLIHRRIEQQARTRPYAVAAIFQGQHLTYAQLNRQANALAQRLIYQGVRPDDRVAIVSRRGLETLVGLLAILKAGAAYVPIDPSHPRERLHYLLSDSAPVVVLTLSSLIKRLPPLAVPLIELDHCIDGQGAENNPQVAGLSSDNLVYVIYTSGSTGQPKGVMVEHRTLANLVDWHCQAFDVKASSHTSCLAGFGFDAMAWEVWPTLCAGATLHLAPVQESGEDIEAMLDWWRAQPLDVSFLPTPVAEYAFSQSQDHPTLRT
ncbi:AMP-binding protein, partial [Pseudomonas syringae]|uniref:condensation domain-containing protein n=3 Tax=Pseudomonas TaxID=286 RepID=UPI001F22D7F0